MDIIEFIIEIFKLLFIAWYEGILEFNIWSWGLTLFVLLLFFGEKIFGEQSLKKKESTLKENIESNKISDTIEEKSLYSLFVAEEATHLKEFTNFMNFDIDLKHHWHPMLNCLSQAIQEGEKNTLTFIIQVLLEGFGIAHYASLRDDCSNELLKKTYDQILIDEARHHGAGIILSGKAKLSKLEEDQIFEYTRMFIKALQQADWLFKATSRFTNNDITKEDKSLFYEQIGYTKKLSARLLKLKAMIAKVDQTGLIENLEREDIFTPSVPT